MYIAVDFDNTLVAQAPYDDVTPLTLMPGAPAALQALKLAGHVLLLWSARASRSLLFDPRLDPLVRAGVRRVSLEQWEASRELHLNRYKQMLAFVEQYLPGMFDAIDDGAGGKPQVDMFIDDKAFKFGSGTGWYEIIRYYGSEHKEP